MRRYLSIIHISAANDDHIQPHEKVTEGEVENEECLNSLRRLLMPRPPPPSHDERVTDQGAESE